MKVFLFSDMHCSIKQLVKLRDFLVSEKGKEIKALVFAGDVVNMGEPVWVVEDLIRFLDKTALPFVWVPGNNDFGRAYHKLNAKYKSLEGRIVELFDRRFSGVGGSPASWAGQYQGESIVDKTLIAGSIFVSHVPPPGVFNYQKKDIPAPLVSDELKVASTKLNGGSVGRRFADAPLVHICGHIHHQWGCSYLGQTKLIKLAAFETGHYAIMDLEDLSVEFGRFI